MVRDLKAKTGKLLDEDNKSADIDTEPKRSTPTKNEKKVAPKVEKGPLVVEPKTKEIDKVEDLEEVAPIDDSTEDAVSEIEEMETSVDLEEEATENEENTLDNIDDEIARYYKEQEDERKKLEEKTRKVILEKTRDINNSRDMDKEYASVLGNMSIDDDEEDDDNIGRAILKEFALDEDDFEGEEEETPLTSFPKEENTEELPEDIGVAEDEVDETELANTEDIEDIKPSAPEMVEEKVKESVESEDKESEPKEVNTTNLLKSLTSKLNAVSEGEKPKKTTTKTSAKKTTSTSKSASKKSAKEDSEAKAKTSKTTTKKSTTSKGTTAKKATKAKTTTKTSSKSASSKSTAGSRAKKSSTVKSANVEEEKIIPDDIVADKTSIQDISREIDSLLDDMAKLNGGVLSVEEKDEIIDSVVAEEIELSSDEKAEKVVRDIRDLAGDDTTDGDSEELDILDNNLEGSNSEDDLENVEVGEPTQVDTNIEESGVDDSNIDNVEIADNLESIEEENLSDMTVVEVDSKDITLEAEEESTSEEVVAPLSDGWEVNDYNKLVGISDVEQTPNTVETVSVDGKLDSSVALNDSDIEYLKEDKVDRDSSNYFYGSDEHNEARSEEKAKEIALAVKEVEVGDKNLNKDIANATPSSKVVPMGEDKTLSEEEKFIKEMELIYTMFGVEGKYKPTNLEDQKKILYVVTECQPFVATGGLADVAGSLPKAIAGLNMDIRVIMPLYGSIKDIYRQDFEFLGNFTVHLSWRQEYCGLFRYYSEGVTYYFVDNERYFKRDNLYGYFDDGERFAYFCKAVVEALPHLDFFPDIIHCNDWQSALVPVYVKTGDWQDNRYRQIKHIYTIHNVEYQGVYGMENLKDLFGIDERYTHDLEYDGAINLTKAAIQLSDKVTTVSHSYCDNLKQPYCSRGLHHIIYRNEYKLSGIINGIDYNFYDPATDETIAYNFDINHLEGKRKCKKAWQEELGLPVDPDTPMLSMVTRLVSHKGLDLITRIMEDLLKEDIQFVIVGTGDQRFIEYFRWLEDRYPTKVRALVDKFSLEYARKNYAGSDIFIMPSKIEPCGISQMVASRYGTVPVVRECGGLKDTITDFGCEGGGNGYTFTNYNSDDLKYQLKRAISDYHDKDGWLQKMNTIMQIDFSWNKSAEEYVDLYKSLLK